MSAIAVNLQAVRQRIEHAAQAAGRQPTASRLLAASKTWLAALLSEALAAGQRVFDENYVQVNVSGEVSKNDCAPSEDVAEQRQAFAEGATLVHIGTAIFGERNYA